MMLSGKVLTEERESNFVEKGRGNEENEKLLRRKEMTGESGEWRLGEETKERIAI